MNRFMQSRSNAGTVIQGLRGTLGALGYLDPRQSLLQDVPDELAMAIGSDSNLSPGGTPVVSTSDGTVALQPARTVAPWRSYVRFALGSIGIGIMALGAGLAGYHGYKRSGGKALNTVGWAVLGAAVPIITVPVAIAQGYGKRRR